MAKCSRTSMKSSHPESGVNRRMLLVSAAATLVAGCSSDQNSDTNMLLGMFNQSINPFGQGPSVQLAEVAAIPYATIGIRLGSSTQSILVLASSDGGRQLWTSSSRIVIETAAGRIITTAGLPYNLSATQINGGDPISGLPHLHSRAKLSRKIDLADKNLYAIETSSIFSAARPATIEILGTQIKAVYATEECTAPTLDWTFTNEYWADIRSGLIWRSVQHVHPDMDAIELETLRPPSV